MASETITEPVSQPEDMDIEAPQPDPTNNGSPTTYKRARDDDDDDEEEDENSNMSKKVKVDDEKSAEEIRMEKIHEIHNVVVSDPVKEVSDPDPDPVSLGPKTFGSSVDMFEYFYQLLHHWPTNFKLNKYEHMVVLDLVKRGHSEPVEKIRTGVNAFEIRNHPKWKTRCFYVVRADNTVEDFSFRKCVDHILPLPENMKVNSDVNKALTGFGKKGGGGGRGGGRGHGRGRGGMAKK